MTYLIILSKKNFLQNVNEFLARKLMHSQLLSIVHEKHLSFDTTPSVDVCQRSCFPCMQSFLIKSVKQSFISKIFISKIKGCF